MLVVVAITDEDETPTSSAESAEEVHDRLVAAKGGDKERLVFLGIGGSEDCEGVYGDADEAEGFTTLELYGPGKTLLHSTDCEGASRCETAFELSTVDAPTYVVARAVQVDGDLLVSAPIWAAP